MLITNLICKVSKIYDELDGVYQEMREYKKSSGKFYIGEVTEFLRLAIRDLVGKAE